MSLDPPLQRYRSETSFYRALDHEPGRSFVVDVDRWERYEARKAAAHNYIDAMSGSRRTPAVMFGRMTGFHAIETLVMLRGNVRIGSASDLGTAGLNIRYLSSDAKNRHSAFGMIG